MRILALACIIFLMAFSLAKAQSGGTVTSVGLNLPSSVFAVSGTPVTTSGTLTGTLQTQSANTVFAGPSSGAAATPTFRSLVTADLPSTVLSGPGSSTSGYIPTWNGTTGNALGAGIAVPVPVASGGTGATSLSTAFDGAYCSTVGYLLVRFTGSWTCGKGVPANPVWWGADPTGTADSTSASSSPARHRGPCSQATSLKTCKTASSWPPVHPACSARTTRLSATRRTSAT